MFEKSLDEIMQEYDEQKDEWETLLSMHNGSVERFMLIPGGRNFYCVQYDKDLQDLKLSEADINELKKETVSKQIGHYQISELTILSSSSYGDVVDEKRNERLISLSEYPNLKRIVLYNNVIVGAIVTDAFNKDAFLSVDNTILTYYASDNEGAGSKDCEVSVRLLLNL